MKADEFAWIREHVWTAAMRKLYAKMPNYVTHCACQYGTTGCCEMGQCERCHRGTPLPSCAGYVCGRDGDTPTHFAEPYAHPHQTATGRQPTAAAMFWYADRTCRWICPHECHQRTRGGQSTLFDLAVCS